MKRRGEYLLYRSAAVSLGLLALFFAYNCFEAAQQRDLWGFAAWTVAFGLASGLYSGADHKAVVAQKYWSEPLTADEFQKLRSGSLGVRYAIYLKPLNTDARIRIGQTLNPFRFVLFNLGMPFIEIQEWLLRASGSEWRFLSEGGITTNIRPVNILVSGDDWFQDVQAVAALCEVIVIVPGKSDGIRKELDYFVAERTHSVILIAPPRDMNDAYYSRIAHADGAVFEAIRAAPKSGAIVLPFLNIDGELKFADYPLTPRSLRVVLNARVLGVPSKEIRIRSTPHQK